MTRPLPNVGAVNHGMAEDLNKRLYSMELIVKDILGLLQQKSEPPRDSPETASPNPIVSRLDGLYKSVIQLQGDFERSSTLVCPECGHYLLEHPDFQQPDRQTSVDGGSMADDDEGDEAWTNGVADETGSQQETDIILEWHGQEPTFHLSKSSSNSSSSPPSVARSITPSSSTSHVPFTTPSSLDRCLSRNRHSPARKSPTPLTMSIQAPATLAPPRTLKRVALQEITSKRSRTCLPNGSSTIVKELLEADPQCSIPRFDRISPPNARVLRLAAAVRSREAVKQFCSLISAKRNLQLYNCLFPRCTGAARRLVALADSQIAARS